MTPYPFVSDEEELAKILAKWNTPGGAPTFLDMFGFDIFANNPGGGAIHKHDLPVDILEYIRPEHREQIIYELYTLSPPKGVLSEVRRALSTGAHKNEFHFYSCGNGAVRVRHARRAEFNSMLQELAAFLYPKQVEFNDQKAYVVNSGDWNFRTQKVRGVSVVARHFHHSILQTNLAKQSLIYPYETNLKRFETPFCRPCPTRPRHGFVDSKVCRSESKFKELASITFQNDSEAEILVMPYADGDWGLLHTPNSLSIAPSFSGCTSGQGKSFPFDYNNLYEPYLLEKAGVEYPYTEIVEHKKHLEIVQLRDGPEVVGNSNYVPESFDMTPDYTVVQALDFLGDLMEYEKVLNAFQAEGQKIVVQASGMPLTSHFGAHAIQRKIPFINNGAITHGKFFPASKNTPTHQPGTFANLLWAMKQRTVHQICTQDEGNPIPYDIADYATLSILIGHTSILWGVNLYPTVIASLVLFINLYLCALYGELRHYKPKKQSVTNHKLQQIGIRAELYRAGFEYPMSKLMGSLPLIEYDFLAPNVWSSSYGGAKWAHSAWQMAKLIDLVDLCIKTPSEQAIHDIIAQWHVCINEEHNGGAIFTKYVENEVFDLAAMNPVSLAFRCYKQLYWIQ